MLRRNNASRWWIRHFVHRNHGAHPSRQGKHTHAAGRQCWPPAGFFLCSRSGRRIFRARRAVVASLSALNNPRCLGRAAPGRERTYVRVRPGRQQKQKARSLSRRMHGHWTDAWVDPPAGPAGQQYIRTLEQLDFGTFRTRLHCRLDHACTPLQLANY